MFHTYTNMDNNSFISVLLDADIDEGTRKVLIEQSPEESDDWRDQICESLSLTVRNQIVAHVPQFLEKRYAPSARNNWTLNVS